MSHQSGCTPALMIGSAILAQAGNIIVVKNVICLFCTLRLNRSMLEATPEDFLAAQGKRNLNLRCSS